MKQTILRPCCALILLTGANTIFAQEAAPAVRVWAHSIDKALDRGKSLLEHLGLGASAAQLGGAITAKLGPTGLSSIDRSRPCGGFLQFDPDPSGALLLPIVQDKDFFDFLHGMAIKGIKESDGFYRLAVPLPIPVYAKVADKYIWITLLNKTGLAAKADPNQLFPQTRSLVSARVRLDRIPNDARQIAISQFEDRLQQALRKSAPNEDASQKAFVEACNQSVARMIAQILQEGEEVSLDLTFEPNADGLQVGLNVTPKIGTSFAKTLMDAGRQSSPFTAASQEPAALVAGLNFALPAPVAQALARVLEDGYREGAASLGDPIKAKQATELFAAVKPTLDAGEFNAIVRLVGPSAKKKFGIVAGVKVRDGNRIGDLFNALAADTKKQLPLADQAKIALDADAVGSVKIHRMMLPVGTGQPRGTTDIFGDATLSLAFRPDAVVGGVGHGSLAAVKSIAGTAKVDGGAPLAQIRINIAQLAPLLAMSPDLGEAAHFLFAKTEDGDCQLDVTGGNQFSISLAIRTPVLQFLGKARAKQAPPAD
jgi:hypothetical protein